MLADEIIKLLNLTPHPEGGYYAETYRSAAVMKNEEGNDRNVCTGIYFLLENEAVSHFHRIKSDETWLFHQGQALEIISIRDGTMQRQILGNNLDKGEFPQITVPANAWFAARVAGASGYGLVSCIVAPGFDFTDFEMASKTNLLAEYPHLDSVINELAFD